MNKILPKREDEVVILMGERGNETLGLFRIGDILYSRDKNKTRTILGREGEGYALYSLENIGESFSLSKL